MVCKISHLKRELLSCKISQSPFFLKCRTERKICLSIYIHLSDKVRGLSIHVGVQRKRKSNIWRESNWETFKIQKKGIEYTYLWKERERILNNFVEKGRSEVIAWDLRTNNKLCLLLQMLDMLTYCRKSAANFWNRSGWDSRLSDFICFVCLLITFLCIF